MSMTFIFLNAEVGLSPVVVNNSKITVTVKSQKSTTWCNDDNVFTANNTYTISVFNHTVDNCYKKTAE